MTLGSKITSGALLSLEEADLVFDDISRLETVGLWNQPDESGKCAVPEWAKELAKRYHVATGSTHVTHEGWRAVAKAYRELSSTGG